MKTKISFDVGCFDRYLQVIVNKSDKAKAEQIMETAYDEWCTDPEIVETDWCCEEYICHCLKANNIEFDVVEETEEAV